MYSQVVSYPTIMLAVPYRKTNMAGSAYRITILTAGVVATPFTLNRLKGEYISVCCNQLCAQLHKTAVILDEVRRFYFKVVHSVHF